MKVSFPQLEFECRTIEHNQKKFYHIDFDGQLLSENIHLVSNEIKKIYDKELLPTMIHLKNLKYTSSSGLSVLLSLWKKLNKEGMKVVFYEIHPFLEELFNLTELNSKFIIKESYDSALEALFS